LIELNAEVRESLSGDFVQTSQLLIWGSNDQVIPISEADFLIDLMPTIEYQVIEGAGHLPSMETQRVRINGGNWIVRFD